MRLRNNMSLRGRWARGRARNSVVFPGALLSKLQAELDDLTAFEVNPSPDPGISVSNGVVTADGTASGNKNIWQRAPEQSPAVSGDLYSVIVDFVGPIQGGTIILNSSLSGVSTSLGALNGADYKRQAVFQVNSAQSSIGAGIRALNGRSFSAESISVYRIQDLLDQPQAIFLTVGQSNWIGHSAGYDRTQAIIPEGCVYTPSGENRQIGADGYPGAPTELMPMMVMEPLSHQSVNEGIGPGADFCAQIRKKVPTDHTVHYFAGNRAARGFKDNDGWDGELVGGNPTGGDAYVQWWTEARKLWARAQAWNPASYIAGVVICVGESDIGGNWDGGGNATESLNGISQMIDDIRAEWGANIPVAISEIGYDDTATAVPEYIFAQHLLATGSGNPTYEKTNCVYVPRPSNWVLTDGTHYDMSTNRQRGKDVARALATML